MFRILALLLLLVTHIQSRPSGASSCTAGGAAVQGSHLSGSPGNKGTLEDGGFILSVHGDEIVSTNDIITVSSFDFDIVVSGVEYKGILIRVGGADADQVVTSTTGLTSEVAVCGGVGAVTHTSRSLKSSATASVSLDAAAELKVDITVVLVNNASESIFFYSSLTIQVVGESGAPALSPILLNTTAPGAKVPVAEPSTITEILESTVPSSVPTNSDTQSPTTSGPAESVVDILGRNRELLILEEAATRAGIISSLSDPTVLFTVFAPNNEAFDDIDSKFLESSRWTIHLRTILAYHVVPRVTILAGKFSGVQEFNTVLEEKVAVSIGAQGAVALKGPFFESQVLQADALAENGVVHVVDSVFLPPFLEQTLLDVLNAGNGYFSAFMELFLRAGIESVLTDMEGEYTLLAPTNQAFLALDSNTTNALKNDTNLLAKVLSYHVIVGVYPSALFQDKLKLETVAGFDISVNITDEGDFIMEKQSTIIGVDSGVAGNGLIHVVGSVLLPPDYSLKSVAAQDDELSSLVSLIDLNGLSTTFSSRGVEYTLFGPTNEALQGLPSYLLTENWASHLRGILHFHTLPFIASSEALTDGLEVSTLLGEDIIVVKNETTLLISGPAFSSSGNVAYSHVVQADIIADNGVLHKVDSTFVPTFMVATLVNVAGGKTELSRLLDLIIFAGVEAEIVKMNRTLFAPTNDAIGNAFNETDDPVAVGRALSYHVATNVYPVFMAEAGHRIETVLGPRLEFSSVNGSIFIQGSKVIDADHPAGNGILHIIDTFLIPPLTDPPTFSPSFKPTTRNTDPPAQDQSPPSLDVSSNASCFYHALSLLAILTAIIA